MQEVIDGSADYDDRRQLADVRPRGCDRGAEHVRRDFELEREREPSLLERLETTLSVQADLGPQEALRGRSLDERRGDGSRTTRHLRWSRGGATFWLFFSWIVKLSSSSSRTAPVLPPLNSPERSFFGREFQHHPKIALGRRRSPSATSS